MDIFINELIAQLLPEIWQVRTQVFVTLLDAVGQNIATSWVGLWGNLFANEWNAVATFTLLLVGSVLLGYRLIRDNLLDSIEYLSSRF